MSKTAPKINKPSSAAFLFHMPASIYRRVGCSSGKPWTLSNATSPSKELDIAADLFLANLLDTGLRALQGSGNSHLSLSKYTEQPQHCSDAGRKWLVSARKTYKIQSQNLQPKYKLPPPQAPPALPDTAIQLGYRFLSNRGLAGKPLMLSSHWGD